ncbi:hypothetical protein EYF80_031215 [Liparis tanakae]|uniref:Uncharacterized protein n=1 Tax=Liparis tanakae TaxID=230148 RepID=A0A4Z2GZS3_9TELE|nr:hypothetical protein EYF80_031215 [Liparis tanakae]
MLTTSLSPELDSDDSSSPYRSFTECWRGVKVVVLREDPVVPPQQRTANSHQANHRYREADGEGDEG